MILGGTYDTLKLNNYIQRAAVTCFKNNVDGSDG